MRTTIAGIAIGLVLGAAALVLANTQDTPNLFKPDGNLSLAATKACLFPAGGWTTIDASTTAALSGQLNDWSRYVIQCDDDAYFAPGTDAAVADTGDGWLAAGAMVEFFTDGTVRYASVRNKSHATADCHYIECR